MRLLVISSCTGKKAVRDCPSPLTQADFDAPDHFHRREAELAKWMLPAAEMYTGWQHRYMMSGIERLRCRFGPAMCSLQIISAGYGLVDERRRIAPYESTFQKKHPSWIRERAQRLGIPEAVRRAIRGHECVIFLLGKEYLLSIHPPLSPLPGQRLIFFTSDIEMVLDAGSTIVPAGKTETRYGACVSLKGKMFELFATGLCRRPEMWNNLCSDETPRTVLSLIEIGQRSI